MTISWDGALRRTPPPHVPRRVADARPGAAKVRVHRRATSTRSKRQPERPYETLERSEPNRTNPQSRLRRILRLGDALAVLVGFALPLLILSEVAPGPWLKIITELVAMTAAGLWAMRFQGLWTDRVASVRAVELSRISRALLMASVLALVFDRASELTIRVSDAAVASAIGWTVLVMWRSSYRSFLASERRHGRCRSKVAVVGTDRRALDLHRLFEVHPELGLSVTSLIGSQRQAEAAGLGHLWQADYIDAAAALAAIDADVVVLSTSDLEPALVRALTSDEQARRRKLYVDPGLARVDFRRVQATAIAHQPFLEVDPVRLSRLELATKRSFDIAVAVLVGVLSAPLLVLVGALIKLDDRGPILFKQRRVGLHGEVFEMYKFRTMVTDAEVRLAAIQEANERVGPLFKLEVDPRVTRVGRFLRASSLDELPQLLNVLLGSMSLVGPRPALSSEVAKFPHELNARHEVRPGITGLWQTEARDNPSFDAYCRLDLFYVENWSLALDAVVLLATVDQLLLRPLIKWRDRRESARFEPTDGLAIDEIAPDETDGARRNPVLVTGVTTAIAVASGGFVGGDIAVRANTS